MPTSLDLYNEVNRVRAEHHVGQLNYSPALNESAQLKCDDMAANDYYGHSNPETGKQGYEFAFEKLPASRYASENLIVGYNRPTAQQVISGWLESQPHKDAILDPKYTHTGFGICTVPSAPDYVFVEHFAEVGE